MLLDETLDEDPEDSNADRDASDNACIEELVSELEPGSLGFTLSSHNMQVGCFAIHKITSLSKKVFHSPTIREECHKLCSHYKLKAKVLLRSVPTRWNTVAEMLARALELQPILLDLCDMAQFNKQDGVKLWRYILEDEEWLVLKQLHPILDVSAVITQ